MERKRNFILRWLILASVEMVVKAQFWGLIFSSQSPSSSAVLSPSVTSRIVASKSSLPSPSTPPVSPTTTPRVCRQRIHKGTSGVITFRQFFNASFPPTYCFKIMASKGEQVRLMLEAVSIGKWCDLSCSKCPYLEIENGIQENGKPSSRICGQLLNKVTLYSHFDQSLELLFATNVTGYINFQASYTVTSYKETVSNECSNYKFLNESNRAMTYVNRSIGNMCDSALSGWYRFSGEAGTQMADSCPKIYHCTTDSPGWLDGTHPTVAEGIVQRKVCFFQQLFVSNCCEFSKDISVRNCGAFYVYRLDPLKCYSRYCGNGLPRAPECSNYKALKEANRATTYRFNLLSLCKNESTLSGWYRFDGEAGNQMADTCVERYQCGARYSGWLSGGHPSVEDGAVVRRVCLTASYCSCCANFVYISVRNCGGFYVYKLTPLPTSYNCSYRYCASNGTKLALPTTLTTEISTSSAAQTTTVPSTRLNSTSSPAQTTTVPSTSKYTESVFNDVSHDVLCFYF
ncbi:uncharacterized protein [Montipora foliosa]|uniref:uncharacterized protein isoform X3 n=1 Tax=Montipora foliosa TaxID=591990 RepID=UPI0035F15540